MPNTTIILNPGTPEAVAQGCQCPCMDNGHGRGYLGDGERFGWVMSDTCPLHGKKENDDGKE